MARCSPVLFKEEFLPLLLPVVVEFIIVMPCLLTFICGDNRLQSPWPQKEGQEKKDKKMSRLDHPALGVAFLLALNTYDYPILGSCIF
jgi:hypothetical protein